MNDKERRSRRITGRERQKSLLFNRDEHPVNLRGCFQGCCAFLIGGGPSLAELDLAKLAAPGCLTMAMNNAPKTVRPDLWVSVDDPSCFLRSIWLDPKIMKLVPFSHVAKHIFDSDAWEFLDRSVADCPNTFFFHRNSHFEATTFLTEDTVNWGSQRRSGGGRSVMLAAMRLLHHLGVRRVFLLGVDFKMDAEYTYHFKQERHRSVIDCNRKTYGLLNERFAELRPMFDEEEFEIFNCNPDSGLGAFPFKSFEEALSMCREGMPEDLTGERTEGLYDKSKNRHSKPRVRRRLPPPEKGPSLAPPNVVNGGTMRLRQRQVPRSYPECGVVVGSDLESEWMLPWWFGNYSRHNSFPVTFIDYGMSLEASRWCAERGTLAKLPGRVPTMPKAWFYKPVNFVMCKAQEILAMDLDTEVRESLTPVFELIGDHPVAAQDPIIFRRYRHLFQPGRYFNTGVLGAPADHPLILEWGKAVWARHTEFRGDQELFNLALYERPGAQITELPERFNRLRVNGDSPDAAVMHWTGAEGKREIRRQLESAADGDGGCNTPSDMQTSSNPFPGGRGGRDYVAFRSLGRCGRLGNQMFRVAAMVGIADSNDFDLRLPSWPIANYLDLGDSSIFGHKVNGRLPTYNLNRHARGRYAYERVRLHSSTNFEGLFQSESWWNGCEDKVRGMFRLKPDLEQFVRECWGELLENSPISLHVRRTDYLLPKNGFFTDAAATGFYRAALEKLPGEVPILVFSDDPEWCNENLFLDEADLRQRLVVVRGDWWRSRPELGRVEIRTRRKTTTRGCDILEMFLMSYCADHVVPNSTYSWWGAWLNPSPRKNVITMENGFDPVWIEREGDISALIPESWQRLPADYV